MYPSIQDRGIDWRSCRNSVPERSGHVLRQPLPNSCASKRTRLRKPGNRLSFYLARACPVVPAPTAPGGRCSMTTAASWLTTDRSEPWAVSLAYPAPVRNTFPHASFFMVQMYLNRFYIGCCWYCSHTADHSAPPPLHKSSIPLQITAFLSCLA